MYFRNCNWGKNKKITRLHRPVTVFPRVFQDSCMRYRLYRKHNTKNSSKARPIPSSSVVSSKKNHHQCAQGESNQKSHKYTTQSKHNQTPIEKGKERPGWEKRTLCLKSLRNTVTNKSKCGFPKVSSRTAT